MKESIYNHYIEYGNIVLFYNALTDSSLLMPAAVFDRYKAEKHDIEKFKTEFTDQFNLLCANGFFTEDDTDEKGLYLNLRYERRYSRTQYILIINPTLDCNLGCRYCYENHVSKSTMSEEMIENVVKHIENKYEADRFRHLFLSFFGGEPLLRPKQIKEIIKKVAAHAKKKKYQLGIAFTSNATLISENILEFLKSYNVSFQITLDGTRETHNKVRVYKRNTAIGTYDKIIFNIMKIGEMLENYNIAVRINYTDETLKDLPAILGDLDFCDRRKVQINLHRVWQADNTSIDKAAVFEFIEQAKQRGFSANCFMTMDSTLYTCYADNYNEAVINFNGDVFKCTARDFGSEHADGKLLDGGMLNWKTDKMLKRVNLPLPEMCENCNLLPVCPGICSQSIIENGENIRCFLDGDFTKEDYIIHHINQQALKNKIYV